MCYKRNRNGIMNSDYFHIAEGIMEHMGAVSSIYIQKYIHKIVELVEIYRRYTLLF